MNTLPWRGNAIVAGIGGCPVRMIPSNTSRFGIHIHTDAPGGGKIAHRSSVTLKTAFLHHIYSATTHGLHHEALKKRNDKRKVTHEAARPRTSSKVFWEGETKEKGPKSPLGSELFFPLGFVSSQSSCLHDIQKS